MCACKIISFYAIKCIENFKSLIIAISSSPSLTSPTFITFLIKPATHMDRSPAAKIRKSQIPTMTTHFNYTRMYVYMYIDVLIYGIIHMSLQANL